MAISQRRQPSFPARGAVQALGDQGADEAWLVWGLALVAGHHGDLEAAVTQIEHARRLYRRVRDSFGEANALMMLAMFAADTGRSDDAERYGGAAVACAEHSGSTEIVARTRTALARILLANGHVDHADEVLEHQVVAVHPNMQGRLAEVRGLLALRHGDLAAAERYLRAAITAFRRGHATARIAEVSLELGKLGRRTQNWALALTGFETADRLGNLRQRAVAAFGMAGLALDQGERTEVLADRLSAPKEMLIAAGESALADTARVDRGGVLLALDRDADARAELEAAVAGFEARGQAESAARARDVLAQLDRRGQAT